MIISIKGENYTGKTTFGCTCPKKIGYHEFDIGSFKRVSPRFKKELEAGEITVVQYPLPKEVTRASLGTAVTAKVIGMQELWEEFCKNFCADLDNPDVKTIVVDTFSQTYQICMDSVLQTIQARQDRKNGNKPVDHYREQLQKQEYRDVNTRMHALLDEAIKSCDKKDTDTIVFVHHMADQYGLIQKGGEIEEGVIGRDAKGWKSNGLAASDLVDWVLLFQRGDAKQKYLGKAQDVNKFYAHAHKTGETRSLGGLVLEDPTHTKLTAQIMIASQALEG